jgi:hypothetical protein
MNSQQSQIELAIASGSQFWLRNVSTASINRAQLGHPGQETNHPEDPQSLRIPLQFRRTTIANTFSNRHLRRLESYVSLRKQKEGTRSNRHYMTQLPLRVPPRGATLIGERLKQPF